MGISSHCTETSASSFAQVMPCGLTGTAAALCSPAHTMGGTNTFPPSVFIIPCIAAGIVLLIPLEWSPVPPQRSAILRRRFLAVGAMRRDQFDSAPREPRAQRIAVVGFVGNHPQGLLPGTPCTMAPAYADRRERRFREPDFRRGCRVKVVSQRNTAAVDHHHPLRPLAPLGFSDSAAPFFAGAKLPSRNKSLEFN